MRWGIVIKGSMIFPRFLREIFLKVHGILQFIKKETIYIFRDVLYTTYSLVTTTTQSRIVSKEQSMADK